MNKYINAEHFDARVREAMGMAMDDLPMEYQEAVQAILAMLKTEPAADVQEVRRGHWIDVNGDRRIFECSVCGGISCCNQAYCNECGAKMDEVEE